MTWLPPWEERLETSWSRSIAAQVQDQVTNAVERGSGAPPHLLVGRLVQTVLTNFQGHTQEIVHKTRLRLGDAYQFAWTPTTPEEGAAL